MGLVVRLVSGGQSGVDRAALTVGQELGLEVGGWCPAGGWAEDVPDLRALFPAMRETESTDPAERTILNVRDSSATLVLTRPGVVSPGTGLTLQVAVRSGHHHLLADVRHAGVVRQWLSRLGPGSGLSLNVAGPRESEAPGIQAEAELLLRAVLA